jgi:hypothetical protein
MRGDDMKRHYILFAALLPIVALGLGGAVTSTWYNGLGTWGHYEQTTGETILMGTPVWDVDDFLGKALNATDTWNFVGDNSGAAAVTSGVGGILRLTTGASDNNADQLAGRLVYAANKCAGIEVRAAMNDVSHTAMAIGYTDATSESAGNLPVLIDNTQVIPAADDFALFVWDAEESTATDLHAVSGKAGVIVNALDLGITLTNTSYHIFTLLFSDTTGQADFYVDGVYEGGIASSITVTDPLCPYVGLINREGAVNTADIDYVKTWQAR